MQRDRVQSRAIRRDFRGYINAAITRDSDGEAAEIIFGELVANAVEHGAGSITARLSADGESVFLEVLDQGAGFAMPSESAMDSAEHERGRGLTIVRSLCGQVRVAHEKGTFVEVRLPVRLQDPAPRCA